MAAVSLRGSDVRWRWEGHWGLGAAVLWFVFLTCVLLFYFVLVFLSGCDFSCLTFFPCSLLAFVLFYAPNFLASLSLQVLRNDDQHRGHEVLW